jgi:uncharacterized protein YecT (DUF1311 family)
MNLDITSNDLMKPLSSSSTRNFNWKGTCQYFSAVQRLLLVTIVVASFEAHSQPHVTETPSFDCNKANNEAERMICGNRELAELDRRMFAAYERLQRRSALTREMVAEQRAWLKSRNVCSDFKCIRSKYAQRLIELEEAVPAPSIATHSNAAGWQYSRGKGYTLCDAIYRRINQFSYPDPMKESNSCGWNAMLSFDDFTEPPWQELDVQKHLDLVYKLIRYSWSGGRPDSIRPSQEPFIRQDVERFIKEGGRVQLWRAKLLSNFYNADHPEAWAPPGLQNVIQLRQSNTTESKELQSRLCPRIPWVGWGGYTYLVNDDLTNVHPDIGWFAAFSMGGTLVLFNGQPYSLGREADLGLSINRDDGRGPDGLCSFKYIKASVPGLKYKAPLHS